MNLSLKRGRFQYKNEVFVQINISKTFFVSKNLRDPLVHFNAQNYTLTVQKRVVNNKKMGSVISKKVHLTSVNSGNFGLLNYKHNIFVLLFSKNAGI